MIFSQAIFSISRPKSCTCVKDIQAAAPLTGSNGTQKKQLVRLIEAFYRSNYDWSLRSSCTKSATMSIYRRLWSIVIAHLWLWACERLWVIIWKWTSELNDPETVISYHDRVNIVEFFICFWQIIIFTMVSIHLSRGVSTISKMGGPTFLVPYVKPLLCDRGLRNHFLTRIVPVFSI